MSKNNTTINQMLKALIGILATRDLGDFETDFIERQAERTFDGEVCAHMNDRERRWVEMLYTRHFLANNTNSEG